VAFKVYLRGTAYSGTTPTTEQSTSMPVGTSNSSAYVLKTLAATTGNAPSATPGNNTLAQTGQQSGMGFAFVSSGLAAQTIAAATWTFAFGASESNINANCFVVPILYVWRPSGGGSKVGTIYDASTALGNEWTTTDEGRVVTFSGSSLTIQDNDVLVFEPWYVATQGMATAYTIHIDFDGTTEPTEAVSLAGDYASYLSNPNTISFFSAPTFVPDENEYYQFPRQQSDDAFVMVW
jgi:hypothetical protein